MYQLLGPTACHDGIGRFLQLKKRHMAEPGVHCLITANDLWPAVKNECTHAFGPVVQMDADSMGDMTPLEIFEHLGLMFRASKGSLLMIRAETSLPLVLVPVLIHLARQMRLHAAYYDTNPHDPPPICLWMTPLAYLNLAQYGFYLIQSISPTRVYLADESEFNQVLKADTILFADPRYQDHETVRKEKQLSTEPWYSEFRLQARRGFPVFDGPQEAAMAAHFLSCWGEDKAPRWVFRGHASHKWRLATTLDRGSSLERLHHRSLEEQERKALTERFVEVLASIEHPLLKQIAGSRDQRLALAQHYGFPTNLLDFTCNPYIAEYFACGSGDPNQAELGVIFAINLQEYEVFLNPYEPWKRLSAQPESLTKARWREDFPDYAFPDPRIIRMPDWELRINRQEGLFVEGAMLGQVGDNVIDRYYFRSKGKSFGGPSPFVDDIDFSRLYESELWLQKIVDEFVSAHL